MKFILTTAFLFTSVFSFAQNRGPITTDVNLEKYSKVIYVSENGSDHSGKGNKASPYKTIQFANAKISKTSESNRAAILVSNGKYGGETIYLKAFVDLFGGYNSQEWIRDIEKYPSIITMSSGQRAFIASDDCTIDGFEISNNKFRGKGAAIYCDGTSPLISNNKFINNISLKPLEWNPKYWHETANDGGAVYGKDGAATKIMNNHFFYNKTENGRGAAVAFDNECDPKITNNIFYMNKTGLDDPMRSSDGGAVSIFRWSKGTIENNLFLSNYADSKNDGGAVFIALWSSTIVTNNFFIDNECTDDAGALFVGGQEHRYDSPLDPFPSKHKFYVTVKSNYFIGNRNSSMNSGAMRFTMESRGEFSNNIVAHNNGIYFQRSEVKIIDNIILDNMLIIETKEGLDKTIIQNNLIWSNFTLSGTEAEVIDNFMLYADGYDGNIEEFPGLADDGLTLNVYSAYFIIDKNYSQIILTSEEIGETENLINRIVKADNKWGIVKSHNNNVLQIWGNFSSVTSLQVLPTYTLKK